MSVTSKETRSGYFCFHSLAATSDPSTVIHYTITVVNAGPSDAQNVVVTQVLPPLSRAR